ncbi:MAG: hypothetical protein ACREJC_10845 [Tepidisphaeraceae bacterium]
MGKTNRSLLLVLLTTAIVVAARPCGAHPACGIVVDAHENIYFVDFTRNRILKCAADGTVSVLVEDRGGRDFSAPHHLSIDQDGNLLTCGDQGGRIWKISPDGIRSQLYPRTGQRGVEPIGSGGDPFDGAPDVTIIFVESQQRRESKLMKITPHGRVELLAGGACGHADGKGAAARFGELHSSRMVFDANGRIYLTDNGASVRRVDPDGTVTTVAGSSDEGFADGKGAAARFRGASGLAIGARGELLVADGGNGRIRRITPQGVVTTLPAQFNDPTGVAFSESGNIYVLVFFAREDRPRVYEVSADGATIVLCQPN